MKNADYPLILGEQAASEAILLLGAKQAPSGLMPVILGPAQSGILLHEAVGHPLEADFNRKGTSAYSGRIGEKVASDLCTIYDAGTIPHERGAINFDDEGVPSSENLLIENGVLRSYMHDRISARHFRTNPTGNGRRESYKKGCFLSGIQRRSSRYFKWRFCLCSYSCMACGGWGKDRTHKKFHLDREWSGCNVKSQHGRKRFCHE